MSMKPSIKLLLRASTALFLTTGAATAQTAPASTSANAADTSLMEIVVTAQKRSESVQQVPISVTVIGADQLARRGVQSVQDLSQASASLEFTAPAAAPGGGGFVRGIGTNQVGNATAASSVSIVLDGVVLGNVPVSDIFDTERVEVLKGPQGTLFGSSVSAGLVNITTKAPVLGETSGYVTTEFGLTGLGSGYSRDVVRAALNVPVTSNSALRLAAHFYDNSGLTNDTITGKDEDQSNYGLRARYLAQLSDKLTFNLIGDYNKTDDRDPGGLIYRAATAGSPLAQALGACGIVASASNTSQCNEQGLYDRAQIGGVSGQFDLDLDGMTLTSITAGRRLHDTTAVDLIGITPSVARQYMQNCNFADCFPVVALYAGTTTIPQVTNHSLFSQELRLTSSDNRDLEWVGGLYYQRTAFANSKPGLLIIHPAAVGMDLTAAEGTQRIHADSEDYAAFGNATWYLEPETRLIGGLRFTHSRVHEEESDLINAGVPDTFAATGYANAATWRAGVQHDFDRDMMVYATVSTGYKAPQINDQLTTTDHTLDPIKAERPIGFEVGVKKTMFDGRLYVDADLFYTDVKDFQTQSCVSGISGLNCSNINVSKVATKGFEWEIFGHPFADTTVNVSGIVNIAEYPQGFIGADGSDMSNKQLNYAPKFKMTISAERQFTLSDTYSLVLGADATIRTKQSMYLSADPVYVVPGQTIFNARLTLKSEDGWSVGLFGRNLGDKVYPTQLYPTTAFAQGGLWQAIDPNARRLVGIQAEAKF
ncbi:TonB-dependent receptor [Nitrospirillum viridazoti Y2]|nr:TonB-dependent receptor [Nitrospirillum amazonense Y2]